MKNLLIALLALMALTSQTNAQQCDERSNVMIVLDRSISMRRDLEGCDSVKILVIVNRDRVNGILRQVQSSLCSTVKYRIRLW